jgi:acyl carrier protein
VLSGAIDVINATLTENTVGQAAAVAPEKTFQEIGLTSLGLLRALLAIERRLGTKKLSPQSLRSLKSVRDIYQLFAGASGDELAKGGAQ